MAAAIATTDAASVFRVPPENWALQGRRVDLAGRRIGETTVEALESSSRSTGRVWRCRCDCGAAFLRSTAWLFRAARDRSTVACEDCTRELHRGRVAEKRWYVTRTLLDMWRSIGTIWSSNAQTRLEQRVLDDLVDAHGPRLTRQSSDLLPASEPGWRPPPHERKPGQQAAYLYPIEDASGDREWRCVDCGSFSSRVFGCVRCVEPVCVACVAAERHVGCVEPACDACLTGRPHDDCADERVTHTLAEVAALFDRTRESIRRIEGDALSKLRFWDDRAGVVARSNLMKRSRWRGDRGDPAPWAWCRCCGWVRILRSLPGQVPIFMVVTHAPWCQRVDERLFHNPDGFYRDSKDFDPSDREMAAARAVARSRDAEHRVKARAAVAKIEGRSEA